MMPDVKFSSGFQWLQEKIHTNAREKGFWDSSRSTGETIALMHSELSEALEADRKPGPDSHLPQYPGLVVELADCIIRIMDFAEYHKLPLAEAILAKHEFNKSRPYKHGKKY